LLETVPQKEPQREKPIRKPKVRLEPIRAHHVVEVWRLYEQFVRQPDHQPDLSEESADTIQSHLFAFMQLPTFSGLQARVGKKVVGIVMGNVVNRSLGRPRAILNIQCLCVDPQFRRQGIATALWKEYGERIKKAGVFNFEALVTEEQARKLPADRLVTIVGGRL
jgi:ribosomal protein S18 acetylase RimI-like enzyme